MTVKLTNAISAVIYAERSARSMSQSALAAAAGMHSVSISKIERGVPLDIGVETLSCIGEAMGIKASEMVARAEQWRDELASDPVESKLSGAELAAIVSLRRVKTFEPELRGR